MRTNYYILRNCLLATILAIAASACGSNHPGNEQPENGEPATPLPSVTTFARGADISWVSEMEHDGLKFYNRDGVETDCFRLMK